MNNEELDIELFDNYLLGKLSSSEIEAFELKLNQNADFKLAFEEHKIFVLGIKDFGKNELKNFLKGEELPEVKTVFLWRKPLQIAASLVLLIGVGVLVKFLVLPNNSAIAIKNSNEKGETVVENLDTNPSNSSNKYLEIESAKKESAEMDAPPPPPITHFEEMEVPPMIKSMDDSYKSEDVQAAEPASPFAEKDDNVGYKVLSEKKLKDTVVLAKLLVYNAVNETYSNKDSRVVSTENKKAIKTLPAPANNSNAGNVNMNEKESVKFKIDSSLLKKNEKAKVALTKSYKVEFWQSPINFKGYKFNGNTMQLYGLDSKNVKLYNVNNSVYLKVNTIVYKLINCTDACIYQTETDNQIVNFILEQ